MTNHSAALAAMSQLKESARTDGAYNTQVEDNTPRELIFGEWLRKGDIVLLFAPTGTGKTRVATGLAYALATGTSFLGDKALRPQQVAYLDGEMGKIDLNGIFTGLEASQDRKLRSGELKLFPCDGFKEEMAPDISSPYGQAVIDGLTINSKIVIIDNLLTTARLQGPRDNDFAQWERIQPWLVKNRAEGKTIILIHHSGKSGEQLGTSRREVIVNHTIQLKRSPLGDRSNLDTLPIEWHWNKNRGFHGEAAQSRYIEFSTTPEGLHRWHCESLTERLLGLFTKLYNEQGIKTARDVLQITASEAYWLKSQMVNIPTEDNEVFDEMF